METATWISLVGSFFTVGVAAAGVAYSYGRLDSRLDGLGKTVEDGFADLKKSRDKSGERLGMVERAIASIESSVHHLDHRETTRRYRLNRNHIESESQGDE